MDAELVGRAEKNEESLEGILVGLLMHDLINLYRYHDDGPPADATRVSFDGGESYAIGWAEVLDHISHDYQGVRWADESSRILGSFHLSLVRLVEGDDSAGAYADLEPGEARSRRRRDGIAAGAAEAMSVDFFVTDRSQLTNSRFRRRHNWLTPAEAIALVGLYLRAQGEFIVVASPVGQHSVNFDKGMFYWVGARELLPAAWRYVSGLMQHGRQTGLEDLQDLPLSVIERTRRVLEARDAVHQSLNRHHSRRAGDDAISSFETALLLLMAALDATAVIAHIVLGLSGPQYHAGWQNPGWIARVQKTSGAPLADIFASGSEHQLALVILQRLRNSIHGAPLQNVTYKKSGDPERSLFLLPAAKREEFLAAISSLGGNPHWGVEVLSEEHILVDPGVMLDRLFPRILSTLNRVMDETPVETLDGVSLSPSDKLPPSEEPKGYPSAFNELYRLSTRWQFGL